MAGTRRLPIGIQNFEKLRKEGYVYIDKTGYLWELVQNFNPHFLSRPRRFGKSLFLSSLKAYFLGQKELFGGLTIEKLEEAQADKREIWQKYPVFYLDFNSETYQDIHSLETIIDNNLSLWEKEYGSELSENSFSSRFAGLIRRAYEKTGKQVAVLIDEYDKPLLETMNDNLELNETYRKILKGFYGVIKSSDEYLRFAFLTGVTKFSKVSIFSDLNNLRDISLEKYYAGICGITEEELKQSFQPEIDGLSAEKNLNYEETITLLKKQYDGYLFHPQGESLYNPFSLLNAFVKKEIGMYWFATGTPSFLVKFLQNQTGNVREILEDAEMTENGLQDYRPDMENPIPILFQAGYLTIKSFDTEFGFYKLGFPNDEVKYGFLDNLVPKFTEELSI